MPKMVWRQATSNGSPGEVEMAIPNWQVKRVFEIVWASRCAQLQLASWASRARVNPDVAGADRHLSSLVPAWPTSGGAPSIARLRQHLDRSGAVGIRQSWGGREIKHDASADGSH